MGQVAWNLFYFLTFSQRSELRSQTIVRAVWESLLPVAAGMVEWHSGKVRPKSGEEEGGAGGGRELAVSRPRTFSPVIANQAAAAGAVLPSTSQEESQNRPLRCWGTVLRQLKVAPLASLPFFDRPNSVQLPAWSCPQNLSTRKPSPFLGLLCVVLLSYQGSL